MKLFLACSFLSIVFFSSCGFMGHKVRGNGNVTTQSRSINDFSGIDVGGAVDVEVIQDSNFSVKVEIDENLQEFIEVYKEGDVLHIHQRNNTNLDPSRDIKVFVSAPEFSRLEASGACSIKSKSVLTTGNDMHIGLSGSCNVDLEIKAPKIKADASGASSITLKGETKEFSVSGSGSTDLKCFGLLTENADVDLSGASDAEIFASVKLNASASGSTDIRYKGNASVTSHVSGSGNVKKVD